MQAEASTFVAYCQEPGFIATAAKGETAAQANGRRYEEKALPFIEHFAKGNGYIFKAKPWIQYRDLLGRVKYCQPDTVLISESDDNLLIIEVKLRHTREAFKQLRLYKDLIRVIHPKFHISTLELCRYYDHSEFKTTVFPALRPHDYPHAAVIWEPREWTQPLN